MLEHIVCLILKKEQFVPAVREDIESLADIVRSELDFSFENRVFFLDMEQSHTVIAVSVWIFQSPEARDLFQNSKAHLSHISRLKPVLIDKMICDRSF